MGLNITDFVKPDETQIKAITETATVRAEAWQTVGDALVEHFKDNKRVGLDTLKTYVDKQVAEYRAAADPAYWNAG